VRAYSVTTGVWTRGILQNEFGVDIAKVTWVVDDEEHVRELKLPPNVERIREGKSLAAMMASGEIQAGLRPALAATDRRSRGGRPGSASRRRRTGSSGRMAVNSLPNGTAGQGSIHSTGWWWSRTPC
jgi:hypothetical protein